MYSLLESKETQSEVRIVFVGDSQVGKSSIINRIVSDHYDDKVEHILREIHVSNQDTLNNLSYTLLDTSAEPGDEQDLSDKIQTADLAVMVYTEQEIDSLYNIKNKWIPYILEKNSKIPLVLVRNKIDLNVNQDDASLRDNDDIYSIMTNYKCIKLAIDMSTRDNKEISNFFLRLQKLIVNPIEPLYISEKNCLTDKFSRILSRVFRIFDQDRDGYFSDKELNEFQSTTFGNRLEPIQIKSLKEYLSSVDKTFISEDEEESISLLGFKEIIKMFIVRDKPETAWAILRNLDYTNDLVYEPSFSPKSPFSYENINIILQDKKQSFELSNNSISFLSNLFRYYDEDKDGCLSAIELTNLFYPIVMPPWLNLYTKNSNNQEEEENLQNNNNFLDNSIFFNPVYPSNTVSNHEGYITLTGYLSMWNLYIHTYPYECIYNIMQLGFADSFEDVAVITNPKYIDEKKYDVYHRTIVHSFIFNLCQEDTINFLNCFINKTTRLPSSPNTMEENNSSTTKQAVDTSSSIYTCVNNTIFEDDFNKNRSPHTLIMSYIPPSKVETALNHIHQCDICCLMFDISDPASFNYLKTIVPQLPASLKLIFIANNKNLSFENCSMAPLYLEARDYCDELQIKPPLFNHVQKNKKDKLATVIYSMACYPNVCVPYYNNKSISKYIKVGLLTTITLTLLGAAVYYLNPDFFKELFEDSSSSSTSDKPTSSATLE